VTKTDPGLTKDRTHQSAAAGAVSKSSGRTSTGKALPVGVAQPSDGVRSVAELAVVIRRDPDNRKKRLKRAEALRECGLDEATVAESLHALGAKLSQNTQVGAVGLATAKLFLHVLKESMHVLEPQKAAANSDSTDTPPFVRFIHNVPRPVRTCTGRRLNPSAASGNSIGSSDGPQARFASWRSPRAGQVPTAGNAARPEAHVFADHRDLPSFLRDEFSKSCGRD
jgi:hypothetical protein